MNRSKFVLQLTIVSLAALLIAFGFQHFLFSENHFPFLIFEIGLFIVSAFLVHQLAISATKSENKYVFSRLTMANTFIKLFVVVGLVVIYKEVLKPADIEFVYPFLLIYVLFTVFETKFLMKLARL